MNDRLDSKKWFAVYVKSRNEKKVFKSLNDIGIESFLPLITRIKQWSDRKKKVDEPLFRSYVFVHITPKEYYDVLQCNGVVKYITFEGKAVAIPDNQIVAIKNYLNDTELHDINYEDFKEGELVRIKSGQMKDLIGRFVKINGKHRIIINIEAIGQSLPVTINLSRSNVEVYDDKQK